MPVAYELAAGAFSGAFDSIRIGPGSVPVAIFTRAENSSHIAAYLPAMSPLEASFTFATMAARSRNSCLICCIKGKDSIAGLVPNCTHPRNCANNSGRDAVGFCGDGFSERTKNRSHASAYWHTI